MKIGGAVGFFLGCSFLSFIQIFYYFFVRLLVDRWKLNREKRKTMKDKRMNENFSVAKKKLKLPQVEGKIRCDVRRKMQQLKNAPFDIIY